MKLYIHIGARKTGTTSVQNALKRQTAKAAEHGLFVSAKFNKEADNIFAHGFMQAPEDKDKCRQWINEAVASGCAAALISSETLTDLRDDEIAALAGLLEGRFDSVEIPFYVRRQDIVATSHYSTGLRGGGTKTTLMSSAMGARGIRGFRYKKIADDWAGVFGADALRIRVFEDPRPKDWSSITDLLEVIGFPGLEQELEFDKDVNVRLTAQQAAYLRRFNLDQDDARVGAPWQQRRFLSHIGELDDTTALPRPARAQAEAFYEQFRSGNESLRRTYLPEREAPLFSEDFSMYPDTQADLDTYLDEADYQVRLAAFKEKQLNPS